MGTAAKALTLLDLFTTTRPEIGLSDAARLAGMNKATVLRLLRELESAGLVEQRRANRAFRIGPGVLRLAALREAAVPFREFAEPLLEELAQVSSETAHIGVLHGDRLLPLSHVQSTAHATRVMMDDIDVLDFHATGSGLAVLAHMPGDFVDRILGQPLPRFTAQTLCDAHAVRAELSRIRMAGFARGRGGVEDDVDSVSAPFFGRDGMPAGAITIAAPSSRMDDRRASELAEIVRNAAMHLTHQTGGILPVSNTAAA